MRKLLTFKNTIVSVVILLAVSQAITGILLHNTRQQLDDTKKTAQLALLDLDAIAQQTSLTPIPGINRLYLAELNLTIPLTPTTSSLRYQHNLTKPGDPEGEVRLTSALMTDHTMHVKSCADMVRLKVEAKPNAYSPDQPLYATVDLTDGRALQVYASTTAECQTAWQAMSPQTMAAAFKDAQAYQAQ